MSNNITKDLSQLAIITITAVVNNDTNTLTKIASFILEDSPDFVQHLFFTSLDKFLETSEKYAANDDNEGSKKNWMTGAAAAMLGAAPIAYMAHQHYTKKNKSNELLRNILLEEPELRENPNTTKRYLDIISEYSPTLLKSPDAVKNTIKEWHRMGGRSIQPEMITKLLEIEEKKTKGTHPIISEGVKGLGAGAVMAAIPALIHAMTNKPKEETSGGFYV